MMKSDLGISRDAERAGLSVSVDSIVDNHRTELNEKLASYFREKMPKFKAYYGEDDWEEVLDAINCYIKDKNINKPRIDLPTMAGADVHLIPITENLSLKVTVYDEYYGDGESDTGARLDRFIITENATTGDVDSMIQMMAQYGIE